MRSLREIVVIGSLLVVFAVSSDWVVAQNTDPLESIVNQLPSGANVIMLVDVQGIQATPIAHSKEWQDSVQAQYQSGLGMMLRTSKTAVVAARVNPRWPEPLWRAALMVENDNGVFAGLEKTFSGNADEHIGFKFLEMQDDTYVTTPKKGITAVFSPLERQQFFGWLQQLKNPSDWIEGSYLRNAVSQFKDPAHQVVIAAQLSHTYSPRTILNEVRDSELLKRNKVDAKQFARLVSSVEGFTVSTTFTDSIHCVVNLTFKEDIAELKPVARDVVFDFLDDSNIGVTGTDKWQTTLQGKSIQVEGPLSIDAFRLMVSELDMISDIPIWATHPSGSTPEPSVVTREYFNVVNRLIADLRNQQTSNNNFASNANLMMRYAKRIRRLPTPFVDDEVVLFSDDAIKMLLESVTELRDTNEKNKADLTGIRQTRSRSGDDFGVISMSAPRSRTRFGRFAGSGGTGKYERAHATQKNSEGVWRKINQKFEEFEKASLALQRKLENKYDLDF